MNVYLHRNQAEKNVQSLYQYDVLYVYTSDEGIDRLLPKIKSTKTSINQALRQSRGFFLYPKKFLKHLQLVFWLG